MSRRRIWVRVRTGQGVASVEEAKDGGLAVSVRARPERDKANRELLRLLSVYFDCPRNRLRIVSGATSRRKLVELSS